MRDASDISVGVVLEQQVGCHWQPLTFFSQKFLATKQKYSTEKYWLCTQLSEISTTFSKKAGKSNFVTDALSREGAVAAEFVSDQEDLFSDWATVAAATALVSAAHQLAAIQANDTELQQFVRNRTKCKFKQISRSGGPAVWCEMSHS